MKTKKEPYFRNTHMQIKKETHKESSLEDYTSDSFRSRRVLVGNDMIEEMMGCGNR